MPWPAWMTGLFAPSRTRAASLTSCGSGAVAIPGDRDVVELSPEIGGPDVGRHLEQHRATLAGPELVEGPAHELRDPLDVGHLRLPLGDVLIVFDGAEVRANEASGGGVTARQQQQRYVVGEGLCRAGEGVLAAGALLHREDADAFAVGRPAEAVGYRHADPLLAAYDGPDPDRGAGLDKRLRREASEELGALHLQYLRYGFDAFHWCSSSISGLLARSPRW